MPGVNRQRWATDPVARREGRARAGQVAGLLVLSAIGAEFLAAYDSSTGRPGAAGSRIAQRLDDAARRGRWRPPGCASAPRSGWGAEPTASRTRAARHPCR
jgi:hypothetical protein